MPALAWSCSADGFPEFVNQRLQDFSGLSPDQICEEWKSILHRDDVEQFEKWWQGLQNSRKAGQTELRLRRFDGEYRWFQIAAAPVHDEQGNLVRWYGINTDIDDRKHAEQELREVERGPSHNHGCHSPIHRGAGAGWHHTLREPGGAGSHGSHPGEVNDEGFLRVSFHPDDIDRVREERRVGLLEGLPFELEMRSLFKSGQYRWQLVQYDPLKDERGQIIRWYVRQPTSTTVRGRKSGSGTRTSFCERKSIALRCLRKLSVRRTDAASAEASGESRASDSTVLILGETGTGKELIARASASEVETRNQGFRPSQLRGDSAIADRFRAFRARKRRIHRRTPTASRQI
jgi:formate hydrogenlyase transcriptional activator